LKGLGRSFEPDKMRLLLFSAAFSFLASCHGAAVPDAESLSMDAVMNIVQEFITSPESYMKELGVRAKRETSPTGFTVFPLPFIGTEVGIKYSDVAEPTGTKMDLRGGEAYLHIDDLQSLIPQAQSKMVKLHAKFDSNAHVISDPLDFLGSFEINYELEHKTGHGTEEGSFKVTSESVEDPKGWKFNVKSETVPFIPLPFVLTPFKPIIPKIISDVDFEVMLSGNDNPMEMGFSVKYVNSETGRDIRWIVKVASEGGKITVSIGDVTHTLEVGVNVGGQQTTLDLKANIMGIPFTGKILCKFVAQGVQLKAEIKKGADIVLKLSGKLEGPMMAWNRMHLRYTVGSAGNGIIDVLREDDKVTLKVGSYKLVVWHGYLRLYKLEAFKNNVPMWTYNFNKEVDMNPGTYQLTLSSMTTLNPGSRLYDVLASSPFGAFQQRSNELKIFIDKNNRNFIFPKFRIEWKVERDGVRLVDIKADTIASPYRFSVSIPKLFEGVAIAENPLTLTIDHQTSSAQRSLVMETNLGGGRRLDASYTPSPLTLGGLIKVEATTAGTQMWKYFGFTEKLNDANQLKLKLTSDFELNPQSMLYNLVVSKYKVLTPFSKRHTELEFFWDKKNKNALLNKFYAKAKVEKDSVLVADVLISTNAVPYKVHAFMPAILGKLRQGWTQIDIDVAHTPGTSLEMKVNHPGAQFRGFKIAKTGNGNEREVEWNGEKLGTGNYALSLSKRMFQTTTNLANGKSLTTTIGWQGDSYLDNALAVELTVDSANSISINSTWKLNKLPDLDLSTPEDGQLNLAVQGVSSKWGDYRINRKVEFSSAARKISLDLTGDSVFSSEALAAYSPIATEVKLALDVDKVDLDGKVKKVIAGKEYSIEFQPGLAMPIIRMGA